MKSSFGCLLFLGIGAILAFVAFIGGSAMLSRAEAVFGAPSPNLGTFQLLRLGIELGFRADALLHPVDENGRPVRFSIGLNEPTSQIVGHLQEAGLIREANLFSIYLIYTGRDTRLLAGDYQLSPAMNAVELTAALLDQTPETVTFVILPGWRLEEIAAALPAAGVNVSPEDLLVAAWDPPEGFVLPFELPEGASLEGYLLAGSYEIDREANALGLITTLVAAFPVYSEELLAGFEQQGLSLHQAVTLASIVERETVIAEEMPLIASVFINRLHNNIQLEADPTVQYALGYDETSGSWWKTPLTSADLVVGSSYNTYANPSLPPGPIAAPSYEALWAVGHPESSDYLFFQAACDGSGRHVFALTYEEHIANNCQ